MHDELLEAALTAIRWPCLFFLKLRPELSKQKRSAIGSVVSPHLLLDLLLKVLRNEYTDSIH